MRTLKSFALLLMVSFISISCFKDNDDTTVTVYQINDFVWRGMNLYYLYKDNSPNLANDRFSNNSEYNNYLNSFYSPEELFENVIYDREFIDRFSRIYSDYFVLEQLFQGTATTNGMEFNLYLAPNSSTEAIGVIRLVSPNTPADYANLKRGDIFYGINGQRLTNSNLGLLLNQETYTLNLGFFNDQGTIEDTDDTIDPTGENVTLSKVVYTENPIFKTKIINTGGENTGYLMYNGFIAGSENELNTVFEDFKSNNIQHLILDLRYNPGGSISTETFLASMITGQFTGDVFAKLVFNENFQSENIDYTFSSQLKNGTPINSLNLNKLYVLTSSSSASASEGLINGLSPYIDVIQIGSKTVGKTQASITIYDSPDYSKRNVNPIHSYAMQPLVANGLNKNGVAVPSTGITPAIEYKYEEVPLNYGTLGDENEPMLALALADIQNATAKFSNIKSSPKIEFKPIAYSANPLEGGMIID